MNVFKNNNNNNKSLRKKIITSRNNMSGKPERSLVLKALLLSKRL